MALSKSTICWTLAMTFLLPPISAEARRRHRKFKGVVIVNQILKLEGHITRNGEEAAEYSGVKQGDVLETDDKSSAVIRIPGLVIFRMGPKTKVKLTQFNERNTGRFDLVSGDMLALFRRAGDHSIKLNRSKITLHGTTLYAVSPPEGKFDQICLCDGKINVQTLMSRNTSSDPAPSAGPLYRATLSAAPTPPGAVIAPKPTPTPTPPPVVQLPQDVQLISQGEHKQCEVSEAGIEMKPQGHLQELHLQTEIAELESLYELP